jgi:hypothetical protein
MTKPKKIMRSFEIGEISCVDTPAQQGALMRIIKSADGDVSMNKLDIGVLAKRYIDPMDGAVPFSTVVVEEMRCQQYYEAVEDVCPIIYAMDTSLKSIAGDVSVPAETKLTMMRNTVEDFMSVIRRMWSDADVVMMSALGKSNEEISEMVKKALSAEQMQEQIATLEKKLEDLTKASTDAGVAAELTTQVETLTAKVGELTTSLEVETSKASMNDQEKAYMSSLGREEQKAFRGMSATDRKKKMGKAADDETLTVKGQTIRKSSVGDEMFAILKAQSEEIESAKKSADTERAARLMGDYEKVAKAAYTNLPGTDLEKAHVLKGIESLSEDVQSTIVKMLAAGEGAIKSAFTRLGDGGGEDIGRQSGLRKGASHPFMGKVREIQKRDSLGHAAAMTKARTEYPDEFAEYRESDAN